MITILLLVGCSINSVVAQLFLKVASRQAVLAFKKNPFRVFLIPSLWAGTSLYGFGTILWIKILTTVDLSFAYPFAALAYTGGVLAGQWMLKEKVTALRWLGVFTIMTGLVFVAFSGISTSIK